MKNYKNKEWLEEAYKKYKFNTEIAKLCNVSNDTIEYWRKKFGIERCSNYKSGARKHFFNEDYFENIDNPNKAYWLGFIMADGCITKSNSKDSYNRLCINLKSSDIEHLNKFQDEIKSHYAIKTKTVISRGHESDICTLRISSIKMCNDLIKLGVGPKKTGQEYIPDIQRKFIKDFIRGFFDGDGSIFGGQDNYYRINFCSASLLIMNQIIDYFKSELDVDLKIYDESHLYSNNFYKIESNSIPVNFKIISHMYSECETFLDRKYERVMSFLNNCSPMQ